MPDNIENWPELSKVERPGRYIGREKEARPNERPDGQGRLLRVALAFPDVYEIAHGHLGHKIIYSLLNNRPGLSAERVYAPWPDWEAVLRRKGHRLASLESRRPLNEFGVVGFSLQYELGYSNILNMLELGGIPLLAEERGDEAPLIVAGGPGACNPEPLADFFDVFFLGDAEKSFVEDMDIIKEWRQEKSPKGELFQRLKGRPGVYIPSLFQPKYKNDGRFAGLAALEPGYEKVSRAIAPDLEAAPFPLCQITSLIKPVHDRVVVEIGRGCSRGCRFCQAGYIYRPVRERRLATVLNLADQNLRSSGQDETSFLSLSAGDHSQIGGLVSGFMDAYAAHGIALSLPSLRVKSLSGHLARQIKRVRKTGFTLAPEAGTQRLRDVINKDLTDDDLLAAAEEAFSLGWRTLKLYFMVGLPTETEEDLAGIAALVRRLKKLGRGTQLNLGVAHFTPKAHTPFQWHPASNMATINERLLKVRDLTRAPGLTPKWNAPGASWVEAILARGDRRLGRVLARVHQAGARFEAWGDRFDPQIWVEALAAENLSEEALLRPFEPGDPRPYSHLFAGVEEEFLLDELEKSKKAETTADCRWSSCLNCGACHDGAAIDLARPETAPELESQPPDEITGRDNLPKANYLINFKKEGGLAFLGHLELVEMFKRAFRRADIKLVMSEGFHPQPKISFLTALPLGVPSQDEYLKVVTAGIIEPEHLAQKLSAALPEDLAIKGARLLPPGKNKIQAQSVVWRIDLPSSPGAETSLAKQPLYPEAVLGYIDKKRHERQYLLTDFIEEARLENDSIFLRIRLGLNGTPKPRASAAALWGLDPETITEAPLCKIETILTE